MYGIDRKQGPCKTSAFTTSIAENRKDSSNFYRLLGADKIQSSNVTKNLGGVTKTNSHQLEHGKRATTQPNSLQGEYRMSRWPSRLAYVTVWMKTPSSLRSLTAAVTKKTVGAKKTCTVAKHKQLPVASVPGLPRSVRV